MQPIVCCSIHFLNGEMVYLETEKPEFCPLCPTPELKYGAPALGWWWGLQVGPIRALNPGSTWQCHAPSSSSLPDSLNLMLLSAGHSTGNLFEILPGYVAFCSVEQHIWDLLAVWECHWLMCVFFFLCPVNLSALMLSSCPFTEWRG